MPLTDISRGIHAPHNGVDTSILAAKKVKTGPQACAVIMSLLTRRYTRDGLARVLGINDSSADARVWELSKIDWVYDTPDTELTSSGSEAHLVSLTDEAVDTLMNDEELFLRIVDGADKHRSRIERKRTVSNGLLPSS